MQLEPGALFSETYLIWNGNINFVGAIIPTPEGRAKISGSVVFSKKKEISFSSPQDDPGILHEKLMSICQFLAKFYKAEIYYRKNRIQSHENDLSSFLTETGYFEN